MSMKPLACLTLEFLAGTSITEAIEEAKQKAQLFNLAYVKFKFNGVGCSISRNANIEHCVEQYHKSCRKETEFKCVIG